MTWGCKPENHPDGCGWAERVTYRNGYGEWWCDTCERSGPSLMHLHSEVPVDSPLPGTSPD